MNRLRLRPLSQTDWFTLLDVTKSRTRPSRFNANGDKLACLLGRISSERQCLLKRLAVCNYMIGRKDSHDRSVIAHGHPPCPQCDRRGRVAFGRLRYNVLFWKISEQLSNGMFLFRIGKNQNPLAWQKPLEARQSFFQQSSV